MNIGTIKQISKTVDMANEIAASAGQGTRWTLFLTNRSFIAQIVATAFALVGVAGVALPFGEDQAVETVAAVGFLVAQGWSAYERLTGKTAVVWNTTQAVKAVEAAKAVNQDALKQTLDRAIRGTQR